MPLSTKLNKHLGLLIFLFSALLSAQDVLELSSGNAEVGQPVDLDLTIQDVPGTAIDTEFFDGFFDVGLYLTYDENLIDSIEFIQEGVSSTAIFSSIPGTGVVRLLATHVTAMPLTLGGPPELYCRLRVTPSAAAAGQTISFGFEDAETFLANAGSIVLRVSQGTLTLNRGQVTVAGVGGTLPVVNSFEATPETIGPGENSTLSWDVSDADTIEITPDVGSVAASGVTNVSPSETTTYTMTASNQFGTDTEQVTVTVSVPGAPVINAFSASANAIIAGNSTTLSWDVDDADSIEIQPGIGSVAATGSVNVSPNSDVTYTLTATNIGGSNSANVSISVVPEVRIVSFSADPTQIQEGGSSQLSWEVQGADSVTLDGSTVNATGSQLVGPTNTTTYTLRATGGLNQIVTRNLAVVVLGDNSLTLSETELDFDNDLSEIQVDLGVNAVGAFTWNHDELPHWLSMNPSGGIVDSERATELGVMIDRTRLYPGQVVDHTVTLSANGLNSIQMNVSARRDRNPAQDTYLWFAHIEAIDGWSSVISATNLSDQQVDILVQVYNPDGTLLQDPTESVLAPLGSFRENFADLPQDIAWAVITMTGATAPAAAGAVVSRSDDGRELYGMGATDAPSASLNVPHIAGDTDVFFTNGTLVNLDNQTRTAAVQTGTGFTIADLSAGAQSAFSFEDVLGTAINNLTWTQMTYDPEKQGAALGAEVFGFNDLQRTVGVGLDDRSSQELYFTHIAADLASFWTGIVVINLGDESSQVNFEPYNKQGELIDNGFQLEFAAGEKQTFVHLGERLDFGAGAEWVKVSSSAPLTGYGLFSNPSGSAGDTFAGLESISTLSNNLVFPHAEETINDGLTAVALINPGDTAANLTFKLVSSIGTVKEEVEWTPLNPKEKLTIVANGIFSQSEIANGDIILVESTQEIAGFELFGNLSGTMGAINAVPFSN